MRHRFNLLITRVEDAWEGDDRKEMSLERMLEFSDPLPKDISREDPESFKLLARYPAILMYEEGLTFPAAQNVRYGRIKDVRIEGKKATFTFVEKKRTTLGKIQMFLDQLHIDRTRFEHTRGHWALKIGKFSRPFQEEFGLKQAWLRAHWQWFAGVLIAVGLVPVMNNWVRLRTGEPGDDVSRRSTQSRSAVPENIRPPQALDAAPPTPSEIFMAIRNAKPFDRQEAGRKYMGLRADWELELVDMSPTTDSARLQLMETGTVAGWVSIRLPLSENPRLRTLEQGTKMRVRGTIKSCDSLWITLEAGSVQLMP